MGSGLESEKVVRSVFFGACFGVRALAIRHLRNEADHIGKQAGAPWHRRLRRTQGEVL
jgi:hypothetical protein